MADTIPSNPVELPTLECDLVMKGGITSGLVYPKAVTRVARDYRIRDIGGTSIGAIAAALTAAAEYWRHAHPTEARVQQGEIDTLFKDLPDNPTEAGLARHLKAREKPFTGGDTGTRGFAGLYQIPQEVGADLMGKFQPQFWTRGLFTFATGLMGIANPVVLVAYILFRRFVLVRTILAAVFVLVAITARLNQLHGQILLGLVLGLALLVYLVFFGISLKKAGKPSWRGPWIGLIMFTVVTTAALAICWVVPNLPDPPEVWSWLRTVSHRLFPDWWEVLEVAIPLVIVLAVLLACKWIYTNERFAGSQRSTWLAVLPLAAFVVAAVTYLWMGGGYSWIVDSVLPISPIRDLIIHILAWIMALIALTLFRDIYLDSAGPIGPFKLADQRHAWNALIALFMLLLAGWLLHTDQDTISALAKDEFRDITSVEVQTVQETATSGGQIGNIAQTAAIYANEAASQTVTIVTLKSADTIGAILIGGTIGWILGMIAAVLYGVLAAIPENYYGLCTGMGKESGRGGKKALTNWLTGKINDVAETLPPKDGEPAKPHLTIGDLATKTTPSINLAMITSDVDRGVPLKLPEGLANYRFDPNEFREFFPATVVDAMTGADVDTSVCRIATRALKTYEKPLCTFAATVEPQDKSRDRALDHLPVIVIARMSMSFPVLFSAVPVYYQKDAESPWHRHYLSDGGIVSNFPIHLFDRALSPRPTFAIDLVDRNVKDMPGSLDQQYSTSPIQPDNGVAAMTTLVQDAATGRLSGFLNDAVNTARGWMDKSQATLPGYKERIVGIHLYKEHGEGGLNLNMEAAMITRLANRGLYGMHQFLEPWNPGLEAKSEWHQHRWLRYLILMRSLENFGQEWNITFNGVPSAGTVHHPSIADLVATAPPGWNKLVHAYPVTTDQRLLTNAFARYANATIQPPGTPFCNGVPCGEFDNLAGLVREPRHLMMPPFD